MKRPFRKPFRRPFRRHPYLLAAFVLALVAAVFFSINMIWQGYSLTHNPHEPIKPWMTISYIARSLGLSADAIDSAMGLPDTRERGLTLKQLAQDLGVTVDEVIADIEAAIKGLSGSAPPKVDAKQ